MGDKVSVDRSLTEKVSVDRSLTEKVSTDKSSTDRSLNDPSSKVVPREITPMGDGVLSSGALQPAEARLLRRNTLPSSPPNEMPRDPRIRHENNQNERLDWVRERNSNTAVMETLVEESSPRVSTVCSTEDEDSNDGFIVQSQCSQIISDSSSLPDDQEEEEFQHINRVMYVAVTLYQSSPFVVLLEKKYSNLYGQLLKSLDKLDDLVWSSF